MGEWLKPAVLKTVSLERGSGVRIPLPPPCTSLLHEGGGGLAMDCLRAGPQERRLGVEGHGGFLLRAARITAVRLQIARLGLVGKVDVENLFQPPHQPGITTGKMISTRWLRLRRIKSALPR